MVKVKFCGIKRLEDLQKAISLGVHYVGFVLYPKSPRYVSLDQLKVLVDTADTIKKVAVMVNPDYEDVRKVFDTGIDMVQLHGEESFSFAKKIGAERVIKAFRVRDKIYVSEEWKKVYAVLLDAYSERLYGGTGKTFSWNLAKDIVNKGFRVFLSGGLNPINVGEAIKQVSPYCVDVSSGIEIEPGIKDHSKMEAFVRAVFQE
ncbi:MAG: phosphoribosylanthranilate isomerase [Hydrogenobacter sp.]|uniref:phosphoribosylanthranilate isomerase n=1 Tax=Hydrogenobacter thermophilus TaxID=940 RepID=UPI0030F6713D